MNDSVHSTGRGPTVGTGYRLAARLARREVIRRPGRTLLVALLVALPVAGMFVADAMVRTGHETPLQSWHAQWGEADAVFNGSSPTDLAALTKALPSGSRMVEARLESESRVVHAAGGHETEVGISRLPLRDPITRGMVDLMSGRLPVGAKEIFLTRDVARALHVSAGQTLHLTAPARTDFLVAGVGEFSGGWGRFSMVLTPGTHLPWKALPGEQPPPALLVALPAHADPNVLVALHARFYQADGALEVSPAIAPQTDYGRVDTQRKVRWSWVVGALVLTVAGIVIASAFAMGARRQLVTLGQLAANGAPPRTLRRVLFLQGTWTGIIGALGGLGLGALALVVLESHVDRIFQRSIHPYTLSVVDVVPMFLLGVATATVAALLPARSTSRLPVLASLAGRRPLGRVPRWLPITGACVSAGGLALFGIAVLGANGASSTHGQVWALTATVGGVAVLLGACAIAPAYVSILEPLAGRTQGSARLAIRSLARQRTRTGAVVSAIAATSALAIAAASLVLSAHLNDVRSSHYIRADEVQLTTYDQNAAVLPPSASLVAAARKIVPGARTTRIETPTRSHVQWSVLDVVPDHPSSDPSDAATYDGDGSVGIPVAIADRATVALYGLRGGDRAGLDRMGALYLGPSSGHAVVALVRATAPVSLTQTPATVESTPPPPAPPIRKFTAAMIDSRRYLTDSLPQLLVTPELARRLGMTARPTTVVLRTPKNLTAAQRTRMADLSTKTIEAENTNGAGQSSSVAYYQPPRGVDPLIIQWVLVGLALVMVLFVVAVNLTLSATETRDERDVLTVVGAAPAAMGRANGYKAALLTAMGSLLAIPVGFLPIVVFIAAANNHRPPVFPWTLTAVLLVGLPIVGGLVTTAASDVALKIRPVRVSTMAHD